MPQKTSTSRGGEKWYSKIKCLCFNDLSDASFLQIFACPMCIPKNRHFLGRNKEYLEAVADTDRTAEEEVREAQKMLLEKHQAFCTAYFEADHQPGDTKLTKAVEDMRRQIRYADGQVGAKQRAMILADALIKPLGDTDIKNSKKPDHHNADRFLSMFSDQEKDIVQKVQDYYATALRIIFEDLDEEFMNRLEYLQEYQRSLKLDTEEAPNVQKPGYEGFAQILLLLLMHNACHEAKEMSNWACVERLTGKKPTAAPPSSYTNKISVETDKILKIFMLAMETIAKKPSIEDLILIHQEVCRISVLKLRYTEEYKLVVSKMCDLLSNYKVYLSEQLDSDDVNSEDIMEQLQQVVKMRKTCWAILSSDENFVYSPVGG